MIALKFNLINFRLVQKKGSFRQTNEERMGTETFRKSFESKASACGKEGGLSMSQFFKGNILVKYARRAP